MKRTLLLGSAWTASAAAAVGLGFLATSLVDASPVPGTVPAAATGTTASSATGSTAGATSDSTAGSTGRSTASSTPSTTSPPPVPSGEQATVGGTVYASCGAGAPSLAGAPAAGWWVDDSPDPGEVEFENGTSKVEVKVTCVGGAPRFEVEGPRRDKSGRDDDRSASPASASSSASYDDSDGRRGGGHGSDDPPGDDSAGRSGSGHGSDDGPGDDSSYRSDDRSGDDDSGRGRGRGRGSDD